MKRRYWAFPASVGSEYLAPGLCWPCIGSVLVLFLFCSASICG